MYRSMDVCSQQRVYISYMKSTPDGRDTEIVDSSMSNLQACLYSPVRHRLATFSPFEALYSLCPRETFPILTHMLTFPTANFNSSKA